MKMSAEIHSGKKDNRIVIELWSFGVKPDRLMDAEEEDDEELCEEEEPGPIPYDLQTSNEFIYSLRHLRTVKEDNLPAEWEHLRGKTGLDKEVKQYLFGRDYHIQAELDFVFAMIIRALRIRQEKKIDLRLKVFKFGFFSQKGIHRAPAFVDILAGRLYNILDEQRYRFACEHVDLDMGSEVEDEGGMKKRDFNHKSFLDHAEQSGSILDTGSFDKPEPILLDDDAI